MKARQPSIEAFIEDYWQHCTFRPGKTPWGGLLNLFIRIGRVKLPYPSAAPNHHYFAGSQFYWDTYFTLLGLVVSGHADLAKGMVDNLCFLFEKFGFIPARNSWTSVGRSQPPYLTRMAFEVYEHGGADRRWLGQVMKIAEKEYKNVWTTGRHFDAETGLSKYAPRWWRRRLTVYESGWDNSSRYGQGDIIPVDLNCQLYQYEKDLAKYHRLMKNKSAAQKWETKAAHRQALIEKYFWDETTGFYYDGHSQLKTLAGFYPLWAGVASPERAQRAKRYLEDFEYPGGLANCEPVAWTGKQWDYPNGWPPHQYITHQGLMNYGFEKDAQRAAGKYVQLCEELYQDTGWLWEKYDVVARRRGRDGRYPTQSGFAWTAGVYLRLKAELKKPQSGRM